MAEFARLCAEAEGHAIRAARIVVAAVAAAGHTAEAAGADSRPQPPLTGASCASLILYAVRIRILEQTIVGARSTKHFTIRWNLYIVCCSLRYTTSCRII